MFKSGELLDTENYRKIFFISHLSEGSDNYILQKYRQSNVYFIFHYIADNYLKKNLEQVTCSLQTVRI